jgi:hypothetical protein
MAAVHFLAATAARSTLAAATTHPRVTPCPATAAFGAVGAGVGGRGDAQAADADEVVRARGGAFGRVALEAAAQDLWAEAAVAGQRHDDPEHCGPHGQHTRGGQD